ncbi:MAG: ABC transporter permease [Anaerolineales bacterium]|nr:ABC transporter permease [Anaerolineales bacterium]
MLRAKLVTRAVPFIFFVFLLIAWQLIVEKFSVPQYILPAPSEIIQRMIKDYSILYFHTVVTLYESVSGFLLACVIGIVVAMLINTSSLVERIIYPYAIMAKVIPVVAIAPLIMIWFGFGITLKSLFLRWFLFPIVVNTVKGLKSTDPQMVKLMKSLSAHPFQIFIKLKVPSSMPYLFAGFKVAITLSVVGAIVGELVGADRGIGHLIMIAQAYLDTELIFSAIFASAVLGWCYFP